MRTIIFVMAGLDPAIHVYVQKSRFLDTRVKPGHDEKTADNALVAPLPYSLTPNPSPDFGRGAFAASAHRLTLALQQQGQAVGSRVGVEIA
jgi:hypothetical protein